MESKNKSFSKEDELLEEIQILKKELKNVKLQNVKYKIALEDSDIDDNDIKKISDAEAICVEQISRLKEQSLVRSFNGEDAKILDILHRNLMLARGKDIKDNKKSKTKTLSIDELMNIAKN